jgi:hypothetical protein
MHRDANEGFPKAALLKELIPISICFALRGDATGTGMISEREFELVVCTRNLRRLPMLSLSCAFRLFPQLSPQLIS